MWVPRFLCPECNVAAAQAGRLAVACPRCGASFEPGDTVRRFLPSDELAHRERFLVQYRAVRAGDGFCSQSPEEYRALPFAAATHPRAAEWAIRARSFRRFTRAISSRGSSLRILDLGAGNGWLANRLAEEGHDVVAVDLFDDESDGLRAFRHYSSRFSTVQADFEALPFEPQQFDVAVFNASLHYAADPVRALAGARRMLRGAGSMAVLDSPMFRDERDGRVMVAEQNALMRAKHGLDDVVRVGCGFVTFSDLTRASAALGMHGHFTRSRGPLAWELRRAISGLRMGRAPAAFGIWMAQ